VAGVSSSEHRVCEHIAGSVAPSRSTVKEHCVAPVSPQSEPVSCLGSKDRVRGWVNPRLTRLGCSVFFCFFLRGAQPLHCKRTLRSSGISAVGAALLFDSGDRVRGWVNPRLGCSVDFYFFYIAPSRSTVKEHCVAPVSPQADPVSYFRSWRWGCSVDNFSFLHYRSRRRRLGLLSVVAPLLALCSCEWFVLLSFVLLSCACACDLLLFCQNTATHTKKRRPGGA